ncbi:hypothetical protein LTR37_001805 [Vermiconidia calcicola]|uniref:Uncharacterized protein n=1 Tax=Vermiconidia calcicola TaxID=1690605 RepID=A0ACC3NXN9_9PEZI|nr:hypothetical protein LTR37_001805 [Vermiconidia calcicola]
MVRAILSSLFGQGSIVRIGPNTLLFNTISAVKEIYTNRQGNVRKAPWYTVIEASAGNANSIHAEVDRNIHASHRRVMEHAFTDRSLRASEVFLVENVQTFQDIILQTKERDKDWSGPFNMSQWSTYLNYDIMGDLVFGRRFNVMTSDAHRSVPRLLMNSTAFIYTFASMPFKAFCRILLASGVLGLPIIGGTMAKDDQKFYQYAEHVLEERIATEENSSKTRKDIMHYLLCATDPLTGKGFSREQLKVESSLLIAAGADTTSLTLAAALFYLVHNPRVKHTLVEELQSVCSSEDWNQISPSKLISLPYLRAVVDETLRLAPPVPSSLPREVLKGGITIDGNNIPEGTIVGVSAYAIHRNSDYFPEPETFYPERWILTDCEETSTPSSLPNVPVPRTRDSVALARQAFVAFSQGSRGCIGRQLAYYELHTALALLLYRFDIRLAKHPLTQRPVKDSTDWREGLVDVMDPKEEKGVKKVWREERKREEQFQLFDRFLSDRNGPMVEFKDRVGGQGLQKTREGFVDAKTTRTA